MFTGQAFQRLDVGGGRAAQLVDVEPEHVVGQRDGVDAADGDLGLEVSLERPACLHVVLQDLQPVGTVEPQR